MNTSPTLKLERIIEKFHREVIPALTNFQDSFQFRTLVESLRDKSITDIMNGIWELKMPFNGANRLAVEYRDGQFIPVLEREQELDTTGFYDRVYQTILEEIRINLQVDGRTFFYPAIGHDWRVPDAWPNSKIIGIDPDKGLNWSRQNGVILRQKADDYGEMQNQLQENGLPLKADLILKGSDFCLPHELPWEHKNVSRLEALKVRLYYWSKIPYLLAQTDEGRTFNDLVTSYLVDDGLVIAISGQDISFCDYYLAGFKKIKIISPEFRQSLQRWNELRDKYTSMGIPLGFWHSSIEPFAYKKR